MDANTRPGLALKLAAVALAALAACLYAGAARVKDSTRAEEAAAGAYYMKDAPAGVAHIDAPAGVADTKGAGAGVYSDDPRDPWNRVFRCLFTRTVRARLSDEFREGAPFGRRSQYRPRLRASRRLFERAEEGDRAIEPLYPSFLSSAGPSAALDEPLYTELRAALTDALADARPRTPLARALMQSDAWAAFDRLHATDPLVERTHASVKRRRGERREELLGLLAEFVHRLALTPSEIAALPDNFRLGARAGLFPDVFAPAGSWTEVEWHSERAHDHEADFRRASRVFALPRTPPADAQQFFDGLRNAHERVMSDLSGVALVTQNLLLDSEGRPVPSPVAYEVQFRFFYRGAEPAAVAQYELSRRLLLSDDFRGGFGAHDAASAHYLPAAGNDFRYATPQFGTPGEGGGHPLVVRLGTRCAACHGEGARVVFTLSSHTTDDPPPVRLLDPASHERALHVARRKAAREDFKALARLRGRAN